VPPIPASFKITRTARLIARAVAFEGEIGANVEQIGTGRATQDMAEHSFASTEALVLRELDPSR
jgi:hypothetical protein